MSRTTTITTTTTATTIRPARHGDSDALLRVAGRDCAAVPAGELLVAEQRGEILAALAPATGLAIADPFAPTADLVELLRLAASTRTPPRRWRLRLGGASRQPLPSCP